MIVFASWRFKKKKSRLLLSIVTGSPALILWAFTTISLSSAWRKIFVSVTTWNFSERMISFNTLPGPTDGSWSTSPTRISLVPGITADKSACIRFRSTMDISSIMITSVSSGFSLFLKNPPTLFSSSGFPLTSSSLWIVWASYPVASVIRFAARPVGAARRILIPSLSKNWIIVLIVVVLPVPGPPVNMSKPCLIASITALCCIGSNSIFSFCSTLFRRFSIMSSGIWQSISRSLSIFAVFNSK